MVSPGGSSNLAAPPDTSVQLWLVDVARCGAGLRQIWDEATGAGLLPCNERSGSSSTEQAGADVPVGREQDVRGLTRVCLRLLLARALGESALHEPFVHGPQGKPSLAAGRLHFSVAHSGTMALLGFSTAGPIGVDLEVVRAPRMSAWRREQLERFAEDLGGRGLPQANPDQRFMQAWVRLEAYGKATGEGIGALLERHRHPKAGHELVSPSLEKAFSVTDVETGDATLAAAIAGPQASSLPPVQRLPCAVGRMAELLRPPHRANTGRP